MHLKIAALSFTHILVLNVYFSDMKYEMMGTTPHVSQTETGHLGTTRELRETTDNSNVIFWRRVI